MEFWFGEVVNKPMTQEDFNKELSCQLYNAVFSYSQYKHKYTTIISVPDDITTFEFIELVSCANKDKQWIFQVTNGNSDAYDIIRQIVKNKQTLTNVKICFQVCYIKNILSEETYMKQAISAMIYGVDYVFFNMKFEGLDKRIVWLDAFRKKGLYNTKIIIPDLEYNNFVISNTDPVFDGVMFYTSSILENLGGKDV